MLQIKTFLGSGFAHADPGDVALANVLDARRAVDEVVNLPLQHWLEVLLHLPSSHLDDDPQVHVSTLFDVLEAGADELDLAILHLIHGAHLQVFVGAGVLAAELDPHVGPAHPLSLEGAAVRDGDGHLGDLHLDAAHLDAALHQSPGLLGIRLPLNVVEGHGDSMFVDGNAGGQNLGDNGVSDDGEAVVKSANGGGVLQVVHLAQSQGKGKATELVVEEHSTRLTTFHAPKGQGCTGGEASGIDSGDGIGAEGHDVGIVAHFHTLFHQLMDDAPSVDIAGEEDEDVTLLQFADDLHRCLVGAGCADDRRKARHASINKLDTPTAQLDVVYGASDTGAGELQARDAFWLLTTGEADSLDSLFSEKGGYAAVQSFPQIGQPRMPLGLGVQE